jgi:hypothetical protein
MSTTLHEYKIFVFCYQLEKDSFALGEAVINNLFQRIFVKKI